MDFNHSTLLFYSESCCWQNLVSIITFFKKKEEQFYCAPIQTLKISEHQVYRDQTINSLKSYQLLGWDTWVFLDCEPKSRFFCREIHFESITHLKVRKGCEWLKPLFLHTPAETLILPRVSTMTDPCIISWRPDMEQSTFMRLVKNHTRTKLWSVVTMVTPRASWMKPSTCLDAVGNWRQSACRGSLSSDAARPCWWQGPFSFSHADTRLMGLSTW